MVLQPPNRQGIDLSSWPTLNDQSSLNKAEIATLPPYNTYVSNFRRVSSLEKAKLLFSFCQGISRVPCIVSTPCFFTTEARDPAIMEQRIFLWTKKSPIRLPRRQGQTLYIYSRMTSHIFACCHLNFKPVALEAAVEGPSRVDIFSRGWYPG